MITNSSPSDLRADKLHLFGPPSSPLVEHMKELIALDLLGKVWGEYVLLPTIINKIKYDWKFIRGHVSYVHLEMVWRERPWHVNEPNLVLPPGCLSLILPLLILIALISG